MASSWASEDGRVALFGTDMLAVLGSLPDASVDACCTDPPYGLAEHPRKRTEQALAAWLAGDRLHVPDGKGFMGRGWDAFVPPPGAWDEVYRVLKPGSWLLAFAAPRTQDLMGLSIRLAGFEIRDSIAWIYGSGFPKSLDVSKAIDKAAGAVREVVGQGRFASRRPRADHSTQGLTFADDAYVRPAGRSLTVPATPEAARWNGWGTTLKPAIEPVLVARKPLDGTVAANVLAHGTGALNIAGCLVAHASAADLAESQGKNQHTRYSNASDRMGANGTYGTWEAGAQRTDYDGSAGRWPPDLILTHFPGCDGSCEPGCPVALAGEHARFFPQTEWGPQDAPFLYAAKAPKSERPAVDGVNPHIAVKPLAVMRWLARLVTPPDGLLIDPFAGTGTTLQAAGLEGFRAVGAENDPDACTLARKRLGLGEFAACEETRP